MISVIVPVYNVDKYLNECITSIVKQTFKDIEIILINDGSSDNSPQICNNWASKDRRIRVFHQENKGLSAARNRGLDEMTGEYVYFVDSDDFIEPYAIEVLYNTIIEYNAQMVIGGFKQVGKDGKYDGGWITKDDGLIAVLKEKDIWARIRETEIVVAWSKLYKAEIWNGIRFLDGVIHEDNEILLHILPQCDSVPYVAKCLYNYRTTEGIMSKPFGIKNFVKCDFLLEQCSYFGNKKWWDLALDYWDIACQYWADGCGTSDGKTAEGRAKLKSIYDKLRSQSIAIPKSEMNIKYRIKIVILKAAPVGYCRLHRTRSKKA